MVTVTPSSIPATSAVDPNGYGDTLTVTTTAAGDMPHAIDLRETAQGAILSESASSLPFGPTAIGTTASSQFTVTNAGNASATVSFGTQTNAFAVSPQGQTLGAGSSYSPIVTFTPGAANAYMDDASMTVDTSTVLCNPLPSAATLSGSGTTTTSVAVAPTNVDFGLVACGSTAAPQAVTIKNDGSASFTWSAALTTARYHVSPMGGSLPPGASATVTINPAAIPQTSAVTPDLYADTLTLTTNAPGDAAHAVSLHQTALGAILSFNPKTLAMGTVPQGQDVQSTFNVVNNGNLTAAAVLKPMGGPDFHLDVTNVNVAGAGGASTATVTFAPRSMGPQSAAVSVTTSTALCGPLPPPLGLSGKGVGNGGGG
jgi:hypothetical protein